MSRVGQTPITIPEAVTITVKGLTVHVKGPKGELDQQLHPLITVKSHSGNLTLSRSNNSKLAKSLHGTLRAIIANMVTGVTEGFKKELDLVGTGYRVAKQGDKLSLTLGFSHPVEIDCPKNLEVNIEGNNKITITGIDKHSVGQFAALIRAHRPPEPYKGKGIRYHDEVVRRKAGKAAKTSE